MGFGITLIHNQQALGERLVRWKSGRDREAPGSPSSTTEVQESMEENLQFFTHLHGAVFNPLNAELNPNCHFLALLGAHHIFHFSRIRVN